MAADDPVTPEPRRFSFRLPRPLWIGVATVVLVVVAAVLRIGLPIYRQQVAIGEIERVGGYVMTRPPNLEWLPEWLQNRIKDDERMRVFGTVEGIGSVAPDFTDETMAHIASLTERRCLYLGRWKTELTVHSGPFPVFEPLEANYRRSDPAQFSDAGLVQLSRMRDLHLLDLNGTRITDAGLAHVGTLTALRSLDLRATNVTDAVVLSPKVERTKTAHLRSRTTSAGGTVHETPDGGPCQRPDSRSRCGASLRVRRGQCKTSNEEFRISHSVLPSPRSPSHPPAVN